MTTTMAMSRGTKSFKFTHVIYDPDDKLSLLMAMITLSPQVILIMYVCSPYIFGGEACVVDLCHAVPRHA